METVREGDQLTAVLVRIGLEVGDRQCRVIGKMFGKIGQCAVQRELFILRKPRVQVNLAIAFSDGIIISI